MIEWAYVELAWIYHVLLEVAFTIGALSVACVVAGVLFIPYELFRKWRRSRMTQDELSRDDEDDDSQTVEKIW